MQELITHETPAKVLSLLGAALVSLGFLYGVTTANASFSGVESQIPDPFAVEYIMPAVDNVAASFSSFVVTNLTNPMKDAVTFHLDSFEVAFNEATDTLSMQIEVESPSVATSYAQVAQNTSSPRVAGAYTESREPRGGLLDALYSLVTK
jgi:hypothetical protein